MAIMKVCQILPQRVLSLVAVIGFFYKKDIKTDPFPYPLLPINSILPIASLVSLWQFVQSSCLAAQYISEL